MLTIAGLVVAISLSFAQNANNAAKSPEQKATKRSEILTQKLGLSPEQKQSVYNLILDKTTKVEAIKAKYTSNKKGMGKELKPLRDNFDAQMKAILTPDQASKWAQLKAEQKAKRAEKKGDKNNHDDKNEKDDHLDD